MRKGLHEGIVERMEATVSEEMVASFGGVIIHNVLSTVSMIYYMEWTGRKIILPYLEDHEEGMGVSIQVRHRSPALLHQVVQFEALVTAVTGNTVVCDVKAKHKKVLVGEGIFVQKILDKKVLQRKIN